MTLPPRGTEKQALREPQESAEMARYVASGPDGVVVVDADGVVKYANSAAHALMGREDGDIVGAEFGFPVMGDTLPEIELRTKSGTLIDAEMRVTSLRRGGEVNYIVAIRDITKRAEESRALLEALQVRDDALAITSHELRSPLTALAAATHALAEEWDTLPAIRRLDLLRRINRQTWRISETVTRVLDAVRVDAGLFQPEPEETVLIDVAIEGVSGLGDQGAEVDIDIDENLTVYASASHVWTILSNFLHNAFKFAPGMVTVGAETTHGWTTFWVADTGPGVPPERMSLLFERYSQHDPDATRGVGLGLWIVRSLAEGYNGTVWCEENPGGGARFLCRLPSRPVGNVKG